MEIINKVAESGLITLNLADFYNKQERVIFDMKDCLFQGLILREKDFRAFVKDFDWSQYQDKNVAIVCSADAIVPTWAYMLLSVKISPYANKVIMGSVENLENELFKDAISKIDLGKYKDERIVVKGCGDIEIPTYAYVEITRVLLPIAKSIMFGEPCSTVPIFKRKD